MTYRMGKTKAIILFLVALLLLACTARQSNNKQLIWADSLMRSLPDSALSVLQNIPTQEFTSPADSAYYALLLTQARDKNYVVQVDDSLIRYAVAHYDKVGDAKMRASAHYYWGCVYRDMNRQAEALREYLIAASLTKETVEKRQLGLIYNNIGYIYYIQNFKEKADSVYQLMEGIAQELKDTTLWAEALSRQGSIAFMKGNDYFGTAEQKLLDAFTVVDRIENKAIKADVSATLSRLYSKMDQGKKALFYAKLNLSLRKDTTRAYQAFLILGDAYYRVGLYDSATFYLNKSLISKDYGRRSDAYMRLADIAMIQGNAVLSMKLERYSSAYKDSLYQSRGNVVTDKIVEAETDAQITLHQLYYKGRLNIYLCVFIPITIIVIMIVFFLYRKNKQYRGKNDLLQKNNQQLEKVNQDLSQHYACLQEEITQRDLEIENLRKELASCRIDEEQREKIRVELDEMVLRRKALVKEAFLHSPLYAKMQAIIKDHLDKDASDKEISDQEWQELIVSMDSQWNNAISRFHVKYQLSKEELYLVCLSLTDFPFAHLAYLMHSSRRTLYRKKNALCERIGVEQNSEFKEILRKI